MATVAPEVFSVECANQAIEAFGSSGSFFNALATIAVAFFVRYYSKERASENEVNIIRDILKTGSEALDAKFPRNFLLLNLLEMPDGSLKSMSKSAVNSVFASSSAGRSGDGKMSQEVLLGQSKMAEFVDSLVMIAEAFCENVPDGAPGKVWKGKFDSITKNVRASIKPFNEFYNGAGGDESRQLFVQALVGTREDWDMVVRLMAAFDKHSPPMPWLLAGPERISVVHPALNDEVTRMT